jgi:4-amino-4-deoxy-L-arabinose transferase-like glycosyltransferase
MISRKEVSFYSLFLSIFIILVLYTLFQDGMFMDGLQYACVSKNLANGEGTFWFPYLSSTWQKQEVNAFMEHPPIVFWLQSLFFKVLGDSIYTERIYSLITAILTAFFIVKIWLLTAPDKLKKLSWLPLIIWITIPVVYWSYQNNMHENTLGVFTLIAVYASLKAVFSDRNSILWITFSGVAILAAVLSKGVPGLFPFSVLFFSWLLFRSFSLRRMILMSAIQICIPVLALLIIMQNEEAYRSLHFYFFERFLFRVNEEPVVTDHLFILGRLFWELFIPLVLTVFLAFYFRDKKPFGKMALFYFLIGLSASLPLMLTTVQRGFYLVPSFPFFALSFAIIIGEYISTWHQRINIQSMKFKIFQVISVLLLIAALTVSIMNAGKPGRQPGLLHDMYLIGEIIPERSVISVGEELWLDWSAQFTLIRHFEICFEYKNGHEYYLRKKTQLNAIPEGYILVDLSTMEYDLYRKAE